LLAENSCVLRWIDAGGDLIAKSGATLWGRASAQGTVSLARGVRFQRVGAPRIVFDGEPKNRPVQTRTYVTLETPPSAQASAWRWMIDGDFDVPENGEVLGS